MYPLTSFTKGMHLLVPQSQQTKQAAVRLKYWWIFYTAHNHFLSRLSVASFSYSYSVQQFQTHFDHRSTQTPPLSGPQGYIGCAFCPKVDKIQTLCIGMESVMFGLAVSLISNQDKYFFSDQNAQQRLLTHTIRWNMADFLLLRGTLRDKYKYRQVWQGGQMERKHIFCCRGWAARMVHNVSVFTSGPYMIIKAQITNILAVRLPNPAHWETILVAASMKEQVSVPSPT